jgi:uncharacterized protein (DUF697 family)
MKNSQGLMNVWKNIQEVDLRPIRAAAEQDVRIALIGQPGSGRHTLAQALRSDPQQPQARTQAPLLIADLDQATEMARVDLVILVLDAVEPDQSAAQTLLTEWVFQGDKVMVFYNKTDLLSEQDSLLPDLDTGAADVIFGSALDRPFLEGPFAGRLLALLPNLELALGRRFPMLRPAVGRNLIGTTSMSNAAFAFGTGLAELVPVLNLPLNVADMVVLTKAQGVLVYKLGLALGMPTEWRYYVGEFGSVLGSGFLWRQLARSLVGLIPLWGIVPKVAVAYSGTHVVGQAVWHWYRTGRHLSAKKMKQLSRSAARRGRELALSFRRRKQTPKALPAPAGFACEACGTVNDEDARFCKQCGVAQGRGGDGE